MRLAVAGKGGSGKTTIAATLARLYAHQGRRVNAVDDDPNPNLAVALGLAPDQLARLSRVPRDQIMEERVDAHGHASLHLTRPFEAVLDEFGARGPDGVEVLMMTGLLGAGRG
ncbi:MAG TPA: AAA family ATPase [Chloroflexota bacterium]|jgi:CO dehydrogenase maturation factor|nr:AAA family ATPase [Chloroflexota bacterium]